MVGADSHRNRWQPYVRAGQDCAHTRERQRAGCVYGTQNGMRDWRANQAHPQLARALLVVGEVAGARKQPGILEPPHAAADVAHQLPARASAAARTARRMLWYPVHRHRFDATTSRISSSVGDGVSRRNAVISIRKPGVQKPHCSPWWSVNACCSGLSASGVPSASTVSTDLPSTWTPNIRHERAGIPSTSTVQ